MVENQHREPDRCADPISERPGFFAQPRPRQPRQHLGAEISGHKDFNALAAFSFVAGPDPATHEERRGLRMPGWVYIVTNRPNGTLYVGVTDDLARRAWEHRAGLVEGFTKQYGLTRLVFAEHYDDMRCGQAAGAKYEALAARLESAADPRPKPRMGRSLRAARLSLVGGRVGPGHERMGAPKTQSAPGFSRNPARASRGNTSAQKYGSSSR